MPGVMISAPKFNYTKQKSEVISFDPIFKAIESYVNDWKQLSKNGYVEDLFYSFLGIKKLKKNLSRCDKIVKNIKKYGANKFKDAAAGLYSDSQCSIKNEIDNLNQKYSQLDLFSKDIKKILGNLHVLGCGNNLKEFCDSQKALGRNIGKKNSDSLKLIKEFIAKQNEIFKISGKMRLRKGVSKSFCENLENFIISASEIGSALGKDNGYIALADDVNKIYSRV